MQIAQVREFMVEEPILIDPDATLQDAARKMKEVNCGFLPVGRNGTPEGIITDRDIVIRAVSEGKDPAQEKVAAYMTREICSCAEDDTLEDAANTMHENNVSRLIVYDGGGKVSGILSFGHIIRTNDNRDEIHTIVECATGRHMAA